MHYPEQKVAAFVQFLDNETTSDAQHQCQTENNSDSVSHS